MAIDTTGYIADLLQARAQIRNNRAELAPLSFPGQERVQEIQETLQRAGAEPDPALLQPGIGERVDFFT
jgi:hypothetical protein